MLTTNSRLTNFQWQTPSNCSFLSIPISIYRLFLDTLYPSYANQSLINNFPTMDNSHEFQIALIASSQMCSHNSLRFLPPGGILKHCTNSPIHIKCLLLRYCYHIGVFVEHFNIFNILI